MSKKQPTEKCSQTGGLIQYPNKRAALDHATDGDAVKLCGRCKHWHVIERRKGRIRG